MADMAAQALARHDVAAVIASPMERAQQTAEPIARVHGLTVGTEPLAIEADNVFEGQRVSVGDGVLRQPRTWKHLWNPFRPSWGEPYEDVAERMRRAVANAREVADGREVVLVSHQYRFGSPGSMRRAGDYGTTPAHASAPWHRSRRWLSMVTD